MVILDMSKKDWFVDWFDTSYYHVLYQNRDEQEAERFIRNILNYLKLPSNSRLLDLACGKGRHAKFLSEFDHDVMGVDLSPNSIQRANEFAHEKLRFQTHDMREVLENEQFDVIFNLFTSFGYFDDESENQRMCDSISKMLLPGGRLLIDFMNAKKVIQNLVSAEEKHLEGLQFDIKRNYDGKHIYKHIQVNDNGHVSQYMERVQALFLADFLTLLETNFEIIGTFGSYDLTSFDEENSDRLILLAHLK